MVNSASKLLNPKKAPAFSNFIFYPLILTTFYQISGRRTIRQARILFNLLLI